MSFLVHSIKTTLPTTVSSKAPAALGALHCIASRPTLARSYTQGQLHQGAQTAFRAFTTGLQTTSSSQNHKSTHSNRQMNGFGPITAPIAAVIAAVVVVGGVAITKATSAATHEKAMQGIMDKVDRLSQIHYHCGPLMGDSYDVQESLKAKIHAQNKSKPDYAGLLKQVSEIQGNIQEIQRNERDTKVLQEKHNYAAKQKPIWALVPFDAELEALKNGFLAIERTVQRIHRLRTLVEQEGKGFAVPPQNLADVHDLCKDLIELVTMVKSQKNSNDWKMVKEKLTILFNNYNELEWKTVGYQMEIQCYQNHLRSLFEGLASSSR